VSLSDRDVGDFGSELRRQSKLRGIAMQCPGKPEDGGRCVKNALVLVACQRK
jgi:hypothetical protein